jgi:hypothetical protein
MVVQYQPAAKVGVQAVLVRYMGTGLGEGWRCTALVPVR